jgi:O-antigen/teichoic acid export membrane protein
VKFISKPVNAYSEKDRGPLSLRQNFSWTLIANIVYGVSQWAIVVVIAKLGEPEMLGCYTLGLAIVTPIFLFCNLHLRTLQATDAQKEYGFNIYFQLRVITTFVALVVISLIILLGNHSPGTAWVIFLVGLVKAIESLSDVIYGLLQQHEKMNYIARSIIFRNVSSFLALISLLYTTHNLPCAIAGMAIVASFTFLLYDVYSCKRLLNSSFQQTATLQKSILKSFKFSIPSCNPRIILKIAWISLPVGLVAMLISLSTNIPRYFVEKSLGQRELGIFAALAYLPTACVILVLALGQAALPRLSQYFTSVDRKAFQKMLFRLVGFAFLLGITSLLLALIAGKQVLILMYQPEYASQVDVFVGLMLWGCIYYISATLGFAVASARYFKISLLLSVLRLGITIFMSWRLIASYGLRGAVLVLLIDEAVQMLGMSAIVLYMLMDLRKREKLLLKP